MKKSKKKLEAPVDNCCCPLCHHPLRMTGFCDASRDFNPEGEFGNLEEEDIEYCDFTEMGYVCTNHNCKYRFTTEKTKKELLYTLYKLMKIAEGYPVLPDTAAPEVY